MYGPKPSGHWTKHDKKHGPGYRGMIPGRRYVVLRAFRDYDGDMHAPGEAWVFLGSAFLPYEEGLSLFVSLDGKQEWHIRMQRLEQEQGPVLDAWEEFVGADPG